MSWGRKQPILLASAQTAGLPPIAFTPSSPHYPQDPALSSPCPPPQPQGRGPALGRPDPSHPQLLSTQPSPGSQWGSEPAGASPISTLGSWAACIPTWLPHLFCTPQPLLQHKRPAALRIKAWPPQCTCTPMGGCRKGDVKWQSGSPWMVTKARRNQRKQDQMTVALSM